MAKSKKNRRATGNTNGRKERKNSNLHGDQWVQELKNEKFEEYYRAQNMMPAAEWPKFMQMLREPLPTTFRLAGSRDASHELNNIIRHTYIPQLSNVTFEGMKILPPTQIQWYPDGLAWQLNVPKSVIRRSPEFKRFHNFLVYETDVGNISRQEAVSMIPPLFLDVYPHHLVLDMCAAPGSKTAQLLEAMHSPSSTQGNHASHIPSGLLIANDSDFKRTHLLVHQSSRLPSPAFMVTNLDASNFPNIALTSWPEPTSSSTSVVRPSPFESLRFDRILCDVPCSGDGTLRKNIGIWGHWQPMDANGLHGLQLRILLRAMKLLKPNGRIIYSTCSLNPVENEAVVAAALRVAPDFELVDVSSQLPSLLRKPGLENWFPVVDSELTMFASYDAFMDDYKTRNKDGIAPQFHTRMMETHWPPSDIANLNLSRCLRIYPHLQDMGGFFVAVLERKKKNTFVVAEDSVPYSNSKRGASQEPEASAPNPKRVKEIVFAQATVPSDHSDEPDRATISCHDGPGSQSLSITSTTLAEDPPPNSAGSQKPAITPTTPGKTLAAKFKEPPYTFLKPDHPQLQQTIIRLGLLPTFPASNIFVRNPDGGESTVPLRSMYFCNDMVKRVVLANDYAKIRLVTAGTKAFTRQDAGGTSNGDQHMVMRQQFRILDDAISVVLPFIPPTSVLPGGRNDLKILLEAYYPLIACFGEPFRSLLGTKENGNHLVRFHVGEKDGVMLNHPLVLPLWKSTASLSLMTDKKSKSALSLRVFGEDITVFGKQNLERQAVSQCRRNVAAMGAQDQDSALGLDTAEVIHDRDVELGVKLENTNTGPGAIIL